MANFAELMAKPVDQRPKDAVYVGPIESLRFEHVVFRHRDAEENALDDASFSARRGDTIAFAGPSGSGKSTLVKLLLGLYRPAAGEVYFNEVSTRRLRYNEARRQVGYVTQETSLFAGTVRENMLFVRPDASDEQILAALEHAQCTALLARLPQGLDTVVGEAGAKLSGGERRRLSIARALLREPRLLVFDEATSALDSLTEQQVKETVRRVFEERTQITLLIAHRLSTVLHATRSTCWRRDGSWRAAATRNWWRLRACTTPCGASRSASARRRQSRDPRKPTRRRKKPCKAAPGGWTADVCHRLPDRLGALRTLRNAARPRQV